MSVDPTGKHNARKAYVDAHKNHGTVETGLDSIWHWLNGVADGIGKFFSGTVARGFKTVWASIHTLVDAYKDFIATYFKLYYWIQIHVLKYLIHLILRRTQMEIVALRVQVKRLIRLIYVATGTVLTIALHAVRVERTARERAVRLAEARAQRDDRMLHQMIEREAASAYRIQQDTRTSTIPVA